MDYGAGGWIWGLVIHGVGARGLGGPWVYAALDFGGQDAVIQVARVGGPGGLWVCALLDFVDLGGQDDVFLGVRAEGLWTCAHDFPDACYIGCVE